MKGLFIAFEGIEGSGKSTQAERLYKWLSSQGYDCVLTKEPGGTEICQKIRNILLDKKNDKLSKFAELFLYLADRAQHVEEVVKPALQSNRIVIGDRFRASTLAYQGGGRGIDKELLCKLNELATQKIEPDITILLDIPPECGLSRIKRGDRIEVEQLEFHSRVRAEYLRIANKNKNKIKVIDGTLPVDEIALQVKEFVKPLLK